jgi:RNA polymerase sigma-70 factor, ECF subfamily
MTATTIPTDLDPALQAAFDAHRRELTGYCYRMLGSPSEADDAVQDTLLKAWQSYERFEGRSSIRSWLYRIAHNVCMDMHRSPQRRARPMEMGPSTRTADVVLGPQLEEYHFVQPARDDAVLDLDGDPAEVAAARESIRLAFVAALQHLPPKQRSALLLCDVLRWPAADVAELLETTVASVNSALQRARATLEAKRGEPLDARLDPEHEALLARYVEAFERYDIPAVVALMREDAVLSMPPWDTWLQGRDDVGDWMLGPGIACKGSRLVPIDVNGTAGYASYKPAPSGRLEPWAIQVIEVADGRIVGHHNFIGAELFAHFGLPPHLDT